MVFKYGRKKDLISFIFLAICRSIETSFIAYILSQYINIAQNSHNTLSLKRITIVSILGLFLTTIVRILYSHAYSQLLAHINIKLKTICLNHIINSNKYNSKIDISFLTNDLKEIENSRVEGELDSITYILQFIFTITISLYNSVFLTMLFLTSVIIPMVIQHAFSHKVEQKANKWENKNRKYTNYVLDTINGRETIKLYNVNKTMLSRVISSAKEMEYALKETEIAKDTALAISSSLMYIFSLILPLTIGVFLIIRGNTTLNTFIFISQLANNFLSPIMSIIEYLNELKVTNGIWNEFKKIKLFTNRNNSLKILETFNNIKLSKISYELNNKVILKNLNLCIRKGDKILIQAPSGWGKSTLLNILTGNYLPNKGKIYLNGKLIKDNFEELHPYYGYIHQKPILFNDTLKFNITLGDTSFTEKDLEKAVKNAGLFDFVKENGWDYQLESTGVNLSGGQAQRIEIARALLKKREILIADEATSALDSQLSKNIHKILLKQENITVIEVAHKISTEESKYFDRVINFND